MRKFKVYCSLALVMMMILLTGVSAPAAALDNLIVNGDYEGEGHGWLDAGSSFAGGMSVENGVLKAEKMASLQDKYADDYIVVTENHTYLFSGYYKYNKPTDAGEYDGVFIKINGVSFSNASSSKTIYLANSGEDWNYFSETFTATSSGESLHVQIAVDTGIPVGTITYFDDMQLIDLTAAQNGNAFDGTMETLSAWETTENVSLETGVVQRGEASMKIAGNGVATQTVPVTNGAYKLKGCVKTGEGYVAGDAKIKIYDGTNKNKCLFTYEVAGNAAWTGVEIDAISCASGVATVEVSNTGTADVFFDNFKLEQSSNIMPNGSFENTESGGIDFINAGVNTSFARTGNTSLSVVASSRLSIKVRKIPCEANKKYNLTYYHYATDCFHEVYIHDGGDNGTSENGVLAYVTKSTIPALDSMKTWNKITIPIETKASTKYIMVQFILRSSPKEQTLFFDDFSLEESNVSETEFRKDGTLLYELTPGEQAITSNYTVELSEAGGALYVVGFYEINKATNVRTLKAVQIKDYPELTAGKHQLSDTITVLVGDTTLNRYELKAYALKGAEINPYGVYNNVRSN